MCWRWCRSKKNKKDNQKYVEYKESTDEKLEQISREIHRIIEEQGRIVEGRPYIDDSGTCNQPNVITRDKNTPANELCWTTFNNSLKPDVDSCSYKHRADRVRKWTESAKNEHASIASFALFSQRLLAIGAPATLVNEAFKCAQDEINHAAFAFALASAYAGRNIEPDSYAPHSVTIVPDVMAIVRGTIEEGCVQETVSALDACREVLEEDDEAVTTVWNQIIKDEVHHATFAWKVVKWAVEKDGTPNELILKMVDEIFSPQSLVKLGGGKYLEEDKLLLNVLKEMFMSSYRTPKEVADKQEVSSHWGVELLVSLCSNVFQAK